MIIIGIISLIFTFLIIRYAKKLYLPRDEWIALCFIFFIFEVIIVATSPSFLYIAIMCGAVLLASSLIFDYNKFKYYKDKFEEKNYSDNEIYIIGENLISEWCRKTDVSMTFDGSHGRIGVAVPYENYGYEFSFSNGIEKNYSLIKTNSVYAFPYIYPLNSYELRDGELVLLKIKNSSRKKIIVETWLKDTFTVQLYKRKIEINLMKLKIHLFYEGMFIECDKKYAESYACLSYFLWLIIFGDRRKIGD